MAHRGLRVAVVGASGYAGAEIVRLLASHPCAEVALATSGRSAGRRLSELCPWLHTDLVLSDFDPASLRADFTFLCQEAGFALEHAPELLATTRVIDLSGDFRLKEPSVYERFYQRERPKGAADVRAVYGLPELTDVEELADAKIVANPGCYPTAALLALMPLIASGTVVGTPIVDAKSGVSGAGRSRKETDYLFSELSGGFKGYAMVGHRHTPEIEQMAGRPVRFSPHLIPAARGIEATIHAQVTKPPSAEMFQAFYNGRPLVQVVGSPPSTKLVHGSNLCLINVDYDASTEFAVVSSVIDNLVKGAAGQAIQNMNIMAGLPEETGLPVSGVWP